MQSFYPKLLVRSSFTLLALSLSLSACGGKDKAGGGGAGDGDGEDSMGGAPPAADVTTCDTDSDCNDFFYCNGQESCEDGICRPGEPIDCDDGIDCTTDRCDEDSRECQSTPPDEDGDGHVDASCEDEDGAPLGDDCDDGDSLAYPGAQEVCDAENRDEDCDPSTFGDRDRDQDGFVDALCCNEQTGGELLCGTDCDDYKTNVNPAATEACDFLDNNCDGDVDEGVSVAMYEDKDHDGRGDDDAGTVQSCAGAVGFSLVDGDCDDTDPEVFTGQFEICDGKDNNCNEAVDEVQEQAPWYKDADGDGYGDPESTPIFSCFRVAGRVLSQNDCDDEENAVNPNAPEVCDALDNDCNGVADYQLGVNDFEDDDDDGAADSACDGGTDCNDLDPRTAEGAQEVCDRIDNDCDGQVDEQTTQNIWYIDEDGDGWGVVIGSALASCEPVAARASQYGDCDDGDSTIRPGVAEICDGIDNDCDGDIDEGAAVSCDIENALSMCRFGQCQVFSCLPGFEDTNNDSSDGCEGTFTPVPTGTGSCSSDSFCNDGDLCNGIESCLAGVCVTGSPINCASGSTAIQGDVFISSGLDLQALAGIELITGDVVIDATTLQSLIGLESLEVIGGDLLIQNNGNLVRLSGSALSNLEVVGGDITVQNNNNLTNVDLPSLVSARSLSILSNPALVNIGTGMDRAFAQLSSIDQNLTIVGNTNLVRIVGFESLGRVGGGYVLEGESSHCQNQGGIVIQSNQSLDRIRGFDALSAVDGDVCLIDSAALTTFEFPALQSIGSALHLLHLNLIGAVGEAEMPSLTSVGEDFVINNVDITFEGTTNLESIFVPNLASVGGRLYVDAGGDFGLVREVAFPNLQDVAYLDLYLPDSGEALTTVDFSSLQTAGSIYVTYDSPTAGVPVWTFPALSNVTSGLNMSVYSPIAEVSAPLLQQVGTLSLFLNLDALQTIGFPSLGQVGGSLDVSTTSTGTNEISEVDFGLLQSVGGNMTLDASIATGALDISSLSTIGTQGTETLTTCVVPYDICADVTRLVNQEGFNAANHVSTCFECGQQTQPQL